MKDQTSPLLTLIGTVHRDREGAVRLKRLLGDLRPDEITLEMSPLALRYRRTEGLRQMRRLEAILDSLAAEMGRPGQELGKHPAIEGIRTLLALPFEYRAASEFAERTGIPLGLIDLSEISAIKLAKVESELITVRNIRVLLNLPETGRTASDESRRIAEAMILTNPEITVRKSFLEKRRGRQGIGPRDRHMEREIRVRLEARPEGRLVHIGGWVHLLEDDRGETLFSRLRDLAPRRVLL